MQDIEKHEKNTAVFAIFSGSASLPPHGPVSVLLANAKQNVMRKVLQYGIAFEEKFGLFFR